MKYNSVEREQKLAKKAENNKLMTLMDAVSRSTLILPFQWTLMIKSTESQACISI
jgi:hypothetical protein